MNFARGEEWDDAYCPLCPAGTASTSFLDCGDRLLDPAFHNYHLVRCSGCGLIYLGPRPALRLAPAHHRQDGYDPFLSISAAHTRFERTYLAARRWTSHWKRRLVRRLLPSGGKVLDVGCGTGEFLASIAGFCSVVGIEPEPAAAAWGHERLGLDIRTGDFGSVELPAHSFQLITLWHALEHIPQPIAALARATSLLAPGGIVLVALPNVASFDARVYGANWVALDAPRHLWHFTPPTLDAAAQTAGLQRSGGGALPLDLFYNVLQSESLTIRASGRRQMIWSPLRMTWAVVGSLASSALRRNPSGMFFMFKG